MAGVDTKKAIVLGVAIANIVGAKYGVGVHFDDIKPGDSTLLTRANYASADCYFIALSLVKASILVFYARLDTRSFIRTAIVMLTSCVIILQTSGIFLTVTTCRAGVHADTDVLPRRCAAVLNATGIVNIVLDCAINALPLVVLYPLRMPRREKVACAGILCMGGIAVIAGCVCCVYVARLASAAQDYSYALADTLNWASVELYAAIIGGSASTFHAMLRRWPPQVQVWDAEGEPGSIRNDEVEAGQSSGAVWRREENANVTTMVKEDKKDHKMMMK